MMPSSSLSIAHQFSCFSSSNHTRQRLYNHHYTRFAQLPNLRLLQVYLFGNSLSTGVRLSVRSDGSDTEISGSQTKTTLSYTPDASIGHVDESSKSYTSAEEIVNGKEMSEPPQKYTATEPRRAAKIHDFCLGIPFGGIVLTGGLTGFIFTRNLSTFSTAVLGGVLLALSTFSLKVWQHGKSSLPFMIGQSVLALGLLWKNLQIYSLSKKLFPAGFYIWLSTAMICFYSYVMLSGGNPPPKKLKSSVVAPS